MEIKKEIANCFYDCQFFGKSMDGMECQHPYFKDKEPYSNMIITHENSRDTIPEKCPLRKEQLVITYELRTTANVRFGWITILSQIMLRITSYIRKRCTKLRGENDLSNKI